MNDDLVALLPHASPLQREKIQARIDHGTNVGAAAAIGCNESLIRRAIQTAQRRASAEPPSKAGWAPVEVTQHYDADGNITGKSVRDGPESWAETGGEDAGPARDGTDGYKVAGVSTYYNAAGEQRGQWVKTKQADVAWRAVLDGVLEAAREDLPRVVPTAAPGHANSKLCNLFTLTDAHVGALAWHREGGADWDLKIAEETILGAFRHMVATAPRGRRAVVAFLGDLMHYDSNKPVTPAHGNLLDSDSRPRKVVSAVVRIMRTIIAMALETHDEVHVVCGEGNHDEYTSGTVLHEIFAILYEDEPRVDVNESVLPYYAFQWGANMLAWHHGHKIAPGQMPLYFATAYPVMWGATKFRVAHCGHRHHKEIKERSGMTTEQHSTLAARDAYAARGGWFSNREASRITYHFDFGEVSRETVTPEMLAA